jgi:hypothetical protein
MWYNGNQGHDGERERNTTSCVEQIRNLSDVKTWQMGYDQHKIGQQAGRQSIPTEEGGDV